ncbi:hypothetical protein FIBSPDRAFT_731619, partial [Athelia psychrophila]
SSKAGMGKSSLINYTFNVDVATVSHQLHGVCDINEPIISPENSRFVLHDSQGFEPGETANLKTVTDFILSRGGGVNLKDRVHAVWLCVEIPFAGGRVFEVGDEEFLKLGLAGKSNPMKPQYRQTLANLIDITQDLVSNQDEGDVWIVSAMAQRASAQAKIDSSIRVGMKRYWQGLASSAHFKGYTLKTCLDTIHSEIVSGWNFCDPENVSLIMDKFFRWALTFDIQLLDDPNNPKFRQQIMAFAQDVTPEASEAPSRL